MIFDTQNPFPLLPLTDYAYHEAQAHAALVDDWLGFECLEVENQIRSLPKNAGEHQNWEHLSLQAFQTPYCEIHNILDLLQLQPGQHIVDLGCAYARMAFVLHRHYPQCGFTGFELEALRVQEAQRVFFHHTGKNLTAFAQDLSAADFAPPQADIYFIFDFGNQRAVEKTLNDLKDLARRQSITVVARGKLSRFCIHKDHPWLTAIQEPQHFAHFSIYQS